MHDTHNRIIYFFIYLLIYVFEYFRQPREQRLQLDSLAGPHPPTLPACLPAFLPSWDAFLSGVGLGGEPPHGESYERYVAFKAPPPTPTSPPPPPDIGFILSSNLSPPFHLFVLTHKHARTRTHTRSQTNKHTQGTEVEGSVWMLIIH